jgi:hypothetical protein
MNMPSGRSQQTRRTGDARSDVFKTGLVIGIDKVDVASSFVATVDPSQRRIGSALPIIVRAEEQLWRSQIRR